MILVLEDGLFCEVRDHSAALPRLRETGNEDESGLGLLVVSQIASRWGTRRTSEGKVVWCELPVRAQHQAARSGRRNVRASGVHQGGVGIAEK